MPSTMRGARSSSILLAAAVFLATAPAWAGAPSPEDIAREVRTTGELHRAGRYDDALASALRAIAMKERAYGPEAVTVAGSLLDAGMAHLAKGDATRSRTALERAVRILDRAPGKEPLLLAAVLSGLGRSREDCQDRTGALESFVRLADTLEGGPLSGSPLHMNGFHNIARLAQLTGRWTTGLEYAEKWLHHAEADGNPDHEKLAMVLFAVGMFAERSIGGEQKALQAFERALTIQERRFGPEHAEIGYTLVGVASLHMKLGRHAQAEKTALRAIALLKKQLGDSDGAVATAESILGMVYYERGEYERAERQLTASMKKLEAVGDSEQAQYVAFLIGSIQAETGNLESAEENVRHALGVITNSKGASHPHVGTTLSKLAQIQIHRSKIPEARETLRKAEGILVATVGRDHPDTCKVRLTSARLAGMNGDWKLAVEKAGPALQALQRGMPASNSSVSDSQLDVALMHLGAGNTGEALGLAESASTGLGAILDDVLATSSEVQRRSFAQTLEWSQNASLSMHLVFARKNARAARLAFDTVLRRKGRVLEAGADSTERLARAATPADRGALDQLKLLRTQLASHVLGGPAPGVSARDHDALVEKVRKQATDIESRLSERYAELAVARRPVTIEAVQRALRPGQAVVEMVLYRPLDPDAPFEYSESGSRYAAYVLKPGGEPEAADLGPVSDLDPLIARARGALEQGDPGYPTLGRELNDRVFTPIRSLLGGARDVLLCPDGALNLLPFAALVDENRSYLISQYRFTYLSSARDLLRQQDSSPSRQPDLILANPSYGERSSTEPGPAGRSRLHFTPLPGTSKEASALARLLPDARLLTEAEATESQIKAVKGPRILHIATHGFFLEPSAKRPKGPLAGRGLEFAMSSGTSPRTLPPLLPEDPLLRSGLALAGANTAHSGDDGILTALEASSMDLWGTKLVTLSACETGVGQVVNGDGVYGLRRALVLAGSQAQVMSLWKVDDDATTALMTGFYQRLNGGAGRSEALREAQLAVMASPGTSHPKFWAPFIPSGDGRSLSGAPAGPVGSVSAAAVPGKLPPGGPHGCGCRTHASADYPAEWIWSLAAAFAAFMRRR